MQLTSKGSNMVVDFYPVKFADGEISTRYMLKTVTFMGKSQSKRYILKRDFDREVKYPRGRLWLRSDRHAHRCTTLQLCNVSCLLIMFLIKNYLHANMNDLQMLTAREQLMEDIDCIIESNFGEVEYKDDVIRQLCDAVCKNFPTK